MKKPKQNLDAGDVMYGVGMFNSSTATPVAEAKATERHRYSYYGDVYRFGEYLYTVPKSKPIVTFAKSHGQAVSQIKYQLKNMLGYYKGSRIDIFEEDVIDEGPVEPDENEFVPKKPKCPKCGERLTDAGQCPVCDLGENPWDLVEALLLLEGLDEAVDNKERELSSEQEAFFKDSKIRDENGNLLVCYHGTDIEDIKIFNVVDVDRPGSFFTPDKRYAKDYADNKSYNTSGKVYEVYLNITKPFDLSNDEQVRIVKEEYIPWAKEHNYRYPENIFKNNIPFDTLADGLYMFLKDNYSDKFDGLVVDEGEAASRGGYATRSFVTFRPNQIKSVNNQKPTKNDDINM